VTAFSHLADLGSRALFGSPSAALRQLATEDAQIRLALPVNRRIGFVQLDAGSGCSALAAQVAGVYAARRSGHVLGVNASAGPHNLIAHAGLDTASSDQPNAERLAARTARDARTGLRQSTTGLVVQDLRHAPLDDASVTGWTEQITPISRFFDLTVTDWGVRPPENDLGAVVSISHTICIVARADRYSAEIAASLVPAIHAHQTQPAVVLALVDIDGSAGQAPLRMFSDESLPICVIPHDPQLARAGDDVARNRSARSRRAASTLAATLLAVGAPATRPLEHIR
jgi:MinD-like ATPase involved in chromosome partitioning or flagellar assembly